MKCTAYHHSYESFRRTTTIEETTTTSRSAVPIVAVMMPGYGEVAEAVPPKVEEPGCGRVSQFQYSRRNELPSCRA